MPPIDALCDELDEAISRSTGSPFRSTSQTGQGGGSISQSLAIEDGRQRFFVKLNSTALNGMFVAEADGLAALRRCPAIRVPQVIAQGTASGRSFLILEHLVLRPLHNRQAGSEAGRALSELHRIEGAQYGWPSDNYIGSNPQSNAVHVTWPFFFAQRRLLPQLSMTRQRSDCKRLIERGETLAERLAALFVDYTPRASLLHGDLWSGNAAIDENGKLALFDPAVYFGDREADLAMSELFGGFPESFYLAYREAWPLAHGYEQRKTLYNLYHVLNHLNLFGGGYLRQAERMIDSLLAEL